jgi:hypothetical protein
MEPRETAVALARGRIALGVAALIAPAVAARALFGGRAGRGATALARMIGGRDLALGLGVVIALDRGAPVRGWLEACALADTVDLVACTLSRDEMLTTSFGPTAALAGASALAHALLSRQLDPPPPAAPGHPEAVVTGHPAERVDSQLRM